MFAQVAGDDGKVFRQMVRVNIFPRLRGGVRQDLKAGHAHVGMIPQEQQTQRAAAGPEVAHGGPARQTAEIGQHHRIRRQAEAAVCDGHRDAAGKILTHLVSPNLEMFESSKNWGVSELYKITARASRTGRCSMYGIIPR